MREPDEFDEDKEDKKRNKFQYNSVVFLLVDSHNKVISKHQITNKSEYTKLLDIAKKKRYYLYHADVKKVDDRFYVSDPWIVDWESVDNIHGSPDKVNYEEPDDPVEQENTDPLKCPQCGKICTSSSGLTLHIKNKHSSQLEDRSQNDKESSDNKSQSDGESFDSLKCPYCNKLCTSSSGLTLHIKGKHK